MKNISYIFLIVLVSACSGTKKTIEPPKKTASQKNSEEDFHQTLSKKTLRPHELWDELLQKYVSESGTVNYAGLKSQHKKLLRYIYVLNLIFQKENFKNLTKEEKLAFWINAYNAFTVDLILRHYPIKSIKDIKNPWKQRHWKLGDKWYNLDEIEHKMLRKMHEPRIHFAINCASISCPILQNTAFTAEKLEAQLIDATKEFLNDPSKNRLAKNNLKISKLFQWFDNDFKQDGSLIEFLNTYSDIQISNDAKKHYMDYNWGLNE